jgi:hypothetical protein
MVERGRDGAVAESHGTTCRHVVPNDRRRSDWQKCHAESKRNRKGLHLNHSLSRVNFGPQNNNCRMCATAALRSAPDTCLRPARSLEGVFLLLLAPATHDTGDSRAGGNARRPWAMTRMRAARPWVSFWSGRRTGTRTLGASDVAHRWVGLRNLHGDGFGITGLVGLLIWKILGL